MVLSAKIPFEMWRCGSCGEAHASGVACPKCGQLSAKTDPNVDYRAKLVGPVRAALDEPLPQAQPISKQGVVDALGAWSNEFFAAVGLLAREDEKAGSSLLAAVAKFKEISAGAAASQTAGHEADFWAAIAGVIASLRSVIGSEFAALTTPDPAKAQALAAEAQRELDAAGAVVSNWSAAHEKAKQHHWFS